MPQPQPPQGFDSFGLSPEILRALQELGYEHPSPIQQACMAHLLAGKDIIGQAQTGTGKTAAFALPLLQQIDIKLAKPQLLVLAPTRELAIQVAEAIQSYARHIKGLKILPVYGGQSYSLQLKPLRQGVQIVVGTPGRVMDHIKRGTLDLSGLKALVLDEADEMLRMGFIDDVKWVMERLPEERQIALFSATMPNAIRDVAQQFLDKPELVKIKSKTTTATTITQRYWQVSGLHKLDALTRILEVEPFDGMIIFVRTKNATVELADRLNARGFSAQALNGDIPQQQREKVIDKLKSSRIDILVATDVAARGLDVERISHVVNYDIPYDAESYVHRIGRTGRAGREGKAILFVAPREKRMLRTIEKVTGHKVEPMQLPSVKNINQQRIKAFQQKIADTLVNEDLSMFRDLLQDYQQQSETPWEDIAAALAKLSQGPDALLLEDKPTPKQQKRERNTSESRDRKRPQREWDSDMPRERKRPQKEVSLTATPLKDYPEIEMIRYRVAVGSKDKVKPGNIVGAIANEAEIESIYIGSIEIYDTFSSVDLPEGMPKEIFRMLKNTRVCGKKLNIEELSSDNAVNRKESGKSDRTFNERNKKGRHKPRKRHKKRDRS